MKLHGNSMVSVYKDIDQSLLPTEYLPDDYKGPCAGPLKCLIGKLMSINVIKLTLSDNNITTCNL